METEVVGQEKKQLLMALTTTAQLVYRVDYETSNHSHDYQLNGLSFCLVGGIPILFIN